MKGMYDLDVYYIIQVVQMIYKLIINLASSFLGALLIMFFLSCVLSIQLGKKKKLAFIVVFTMVNGILSSLLSSEAYKPIILLPVSIIIIKAILRISLIDAFIAFSSYVIGLAIGSALVSLVAGVIIKDPLLDAFQSSLLWLIFGNLASNGFAFLLILIIKPFKQLVTSINRNKFLYILTGITLLIVASAFALHYYMNAFSFFAYSIISVTVISYCIFTIIVWFSTLRKTIDEEELAHQRFYNKSLHSTLFDLRRFKHDWSNNMTVIYSMLKMDKIDELKEYVSELIVQNTEQINMEIYNIKNAGLFGILSSKVSQAQAVGINIELSVIGEVENIPHIKISELCEIVGILLDNAIEEAAKNRKTVDVLVRKSEQYMEISISNICTDSPELQLINKDGYSTKGQNRGMGLAIVKSIISKYSDVFHATTYEGDVFTQTIEITDGRKG